MTAQISDEVLFGATWYNVTAVDGAGLFDPGRHGLEPQMIGTGCWRGYACRYAVVERRLVLRDLLVGSAEEPATLGDVQPLFDENEQAWHYKELDFAVDFTGRLLVGEGDVDDRPYLNMGFWPAWMFAEVHDLTFQDGTLLTDVDCSAELAAVRAKISATAAEPAPGESTEDWVSRAFSLTYDYSWPK